LADLEDKFQVPASHGGSSLLSLIGNALELEQRSGSWMQQAHLPCLKVA